MNITTEAAQVIYSGKFEPSLFADAISSGVSPRSLAFRLFPVSNAPDDMKMQIADALVRGFKFVYGRIDAFPPELSSAFKEFGGAVASTLVSRRNEEAMALVIDSYRGTAHACSHAAPSRRLRGCL